MITKVTTKEPAEPIKSGQDSFLTIAVTWNRTSSTKSHPTACTYPDSFLHPRLGFLQNHRDALPLPWASYNKSQKSCNSPLWLCIHCMQISNIKGVCLFVFCHSEIHKSLSVLTNLSISKSDCCLVVTILCRCNGKGSTHFNKAPVPVPHWTHLHYLQ